MARLLFARAALFETTAKRLPVRTLGSSPNRTTSPKSECGRKPEATLMDWLELLCIPRFITGNRPNGRRRLRRALNDVADDAFVTDGIWESRKRLVIADLDDK